MVRTIKEIKIAQAWHNAGVTIAQARAKLYDPVCPHHVSLIGGKTVKVHSNKILATMHNLIKSK